VRQRVIVVSFALVELSALGVFLVTRSGDDDSGPTTDDRAVKVTGRGANGNASWASDQGLAPDLQGTPALEQPATPADGFVEIHTTASGFPKIGAKVRLYWRGPVDPNTDKTVWRFAGGGETDADGFVRIPARAGTYLASARAPGLAATHREFERPMGEPVTRLELTLGAGVSVSGRTVTKTSGDPVPMAQVVFTPWAGRSDPAGLAEVPPEERSACASDARGVFRIDGLAPAAYGVEGSAPGFATVTERRVVVPRGDDLVLSMSQAAFVEGFVLAQDGSPAPGAEVTVTGGGEVYTSASGAGGGFSAQVTPGHYQVLARLGSDAGRSPTRVTVAAGATARGITVRLGAAGSVAGTVVADSTGSPVAGAEIAVSPNGESGDSGRARTDASGAFVVDRLAPGNYDVVASAEGFTGFIRWGISVAAGQKFPLTLRLKGTGSVEGTVTDPDERPVEGVVVSAETNWGAEPLATLRQARTASDGRYRIEGVAAGGPVLRVKRDGTVVAPERSVEVHEGDTARADFVLRETGTLSGAVTRGTGPNPKIELLAAIPADGGNGEWTTEQFDAGGRYRLSLPPGQYLIRVVWDSGGRRDFSAGEVQVAPGGTTNFDVSLPGGDDGLGGVVFTPDGSPVPGAWIWMMGGRQVVGYERSDAEGHFSLPLPPGIEGPMTLFARNGGQSAIVHDVNPSSGSINVNLSASSSIAGHVDPGDGQPVQSFTVTLALLDSGGPASFGTNGGSVFNGDRFSIEDVPAEHVMVNVATDDGRSGQAVVALSPGTGQAVVIELGASGHIVGRVVDSNSGQPAGPGVVIVDRASTRIQSDGQFDLQGVAVGSQSIRVFTAHGSSEIQTEVPAGETLDLGDVVVPGAPQ
jgi:hypothetical protein